MHMHHGTLAAAKPTHISDAKDAAHGACDSGLRSSFEDSRSSDVLNGAGLPACSSCALHSGFRSLELVALKSQV